MAPLLVLGLGAWVLVDMVTQGRAANIPVDEATRVLQDPAQSNERRKRALFRLTKYERHRSELYHRLLEAEGDPEIREWLKRLLQERSGR